MSSFRPQTTCAHGVTGHDYAIYSAHAPNGCYLSYQADCDGCIQAVLVVEEMAKQACKAARQALAARSPQKLDVARAESLNPVQYEDYVHA